MSSKLPFNERLNQEMLQKQAEYEKLMRTPRMRIKKFVSDKIEWLRTWIEIKIYRTRDRKLWKICPRCGYTRINKKTVGNYKFLNCPSCGLEMDVFMAFLINFEMKKKGIFPCPLYFDRLYGAPCDEKILPRHWGLGS
jgi:hypothetical protein